MVIWFPWVYSRVDSRTKELQLLVDWEFRIVYKVHMDTATFTLYFMFVLCYYHKWSSEIVQKSLSDIDAPVITLVYMDIYKEK